MIILTVEMEALPQKLDELLQTIRAMIAPTREEKGCLSYNAFQSVENENVILLVEEWARQEDLDNHLRSERFGALLGAKSLLKKPLEVRVIAVSYTGGMEVVKKVRGKSNH